MDSDSESEVQLPAVLNRPKVANYVVNEHITVDTRDHEDHTFCGVMFDVCCKDVLPVAFIEITSVAVRGDLGPLTVWVTPETFHGKNEDGSHWRLVYSGKHAPSADRLVPLELPEPVRVGRGESVGLYVHSSLPGDTGIVYDDERSRHTHDDDLFRITPGLAHISNRPFGRRGMWGHPWRTRREFVGRLNLGVGWQLWNPETHKAFPAPFRRSALALFLGAGRRSSPLHALSDAVLMYILNMCRYDWFGLPVAEAAARGSGGRRRRLAGGPEEVGGFRGTACGWRWQSDVDSDDSPASSASSISGMEW
mmetsp:Transcript_62693/g.178009  ORF Transcript_62693/g.178009 Transcript_62693/m.178009 type:complete len:308 (-) Transcript_62693:126-1049(-)